MANEKPQLNYDYPTDSLTYAQYLATDWEALLLTSKNARKHNIDFYYLTLRTAYASFYTKRYDDALVYFEKAETMQMSNEITKETHYLSALYAGKAKTTELLYNLLSEDQKKRYNAPTYKRISSFSLNYGYNINTDFSKLLSQEIHGGSDVLGERILLKDIHFQDLALQHSINSSLSVEQSLGHMQLSKQQSFYYQDYANNTPKNDEYSTTTSQWQYYIKAAYNLDDKLSIVPSFTLIHFDAENIFGSYDSTTTLYTFTKGSIEDYQYLFSLNANYRIGRALLSVSGSQLRGGKDSRWQYGGGLTLYPFKNKRHYITGNIYRLDSYLYRSNSKWKTLWQIKAGWNIDKVWMTAVLSQGDHQFFADNNGLVVFNTYESIQSQIGGNIHFPLFTNQLWFNLYYRYIDYNSAFIYLDDDLKLRKKTISHNNHSITGGLSWKF